MWKQRLILIVVSIVVIVALYSLPKVVVQNEEENMPGGEETTGQQVDAEEEPLLEDHNFEINSADEQKLAAYNSRFMEGSLEDKLEYADSIASLYLKYSKYDSAAKYLEYVAISNPDELVFQRVADAYYEAYSFAMDKQKAASFGDKARYFFNKILDRDPTRLDIKNKVAMTYMTSDNPMQGIAMLREILEADPENEMALFNMGTLAIQSGQYERAEERFKKLVSVNAQNLQGQFYLGLCYFEQGKTSEARKQFELVKSMESDPAVVATAESYLRELN
jgi:tetratricopeptide (TPR) repeat protein